MHGWFATVSMGLVSIFSEYNLQSLLTYTLAISSWFLPPFNETVLPYILTGVQISYCHLLTSPADYVAITMTLTFTNGSTTPQSVPVTILDDSIVEGSESFSLTLTTTETNVTVNPASATVNIQDDSNDGKLVRMIG